MLPLKHQFCFNLSRNLPSIYFTHKPLFSIFGQIFILYPNKERASFIFVVEPLWWLWRTSWVCKIWKHNWRNLKNWLKKMNARRWMRRRDYCNFKEITQWQKELKITKIKLFWFIMLRYVEFQKYNAIL